MCINCTKSAPDTFADIDPFETITLTEDGVNWVKPNLLNEDGPRHILSDAEPVSDRFTGIQNHFDMSVNNLDALFGTAERDAQDKKPALSLDEIRTTIPGDTSTTATLAVGSPVSGTIDFNYDSDWYEVTVTAGTTYQFNLTSTGSNALPAGDMFLGLYNINGNLITVDDDGGAGAGGRISFTANRDGVVYVSAEAYASGTGDYDLTAQLLIEDDYANGAYAPDAGTLTVDGAAETGTLDYVTDQDWFAVELTAGVTYTFSLTGTGGSALGDPAMGLHNRNGVLLAFNDDTVGTDPEIVYTATSTGTYYVSAEAYTGFDSAAVGDYSLSVTSSGGGGGGGSDPLDAIDWGTQTSTSNITVYFAGAGESFSGETSDGWTQADINSAMAGLKMFENYIDVTFTQVFSSAGATFKLMTDQLGGETLGYFYPPGQGAASGIGVFATNGYGWSASGLQEGGFGWVTLIHEFGHGLGLAHPHDDGGTSEVMSGVSNSSDTGDFALNQGVYTTMTYADGWQSSPYGQSNAVNYGWQSTIMALDIALLQSKYGANTTYNSGNSQYELHKQNTNGTDWVSIWDTGGTQDWILANTPKDAVIDLRPATLQYETGGGGYVSHVDGIHGGFTIASGVEIERARGGNGDDLINGNDLDNVLIGREGIDEINGFAGDDRIYGNKGNDILNGGTGRDQLKGALGDDTYVFVEGDSLVGNIDRVYGFGIGDTLDLVAHNYVGTGSFTSDTGVEVQLVAVGNKWRFDIDYDGDNVADEQILLISTEANIEFVSDGDNITAQAIPAAVAEAPDLAFEPSAPSDADIYMEDIANGAEEWLMIA